MKFLISLMLFGFLNVSSVSWLTDFNTARAEAAQSHKFILLNFSGSDWCIPCIRLHKDIFESEAFTNYANNNLVLLNSDFPRLKKNQLVKEQVKKNEALADRYNPHGIFPLTLLLDTNGKIIRQWEGLPNETPERFVGEIDASVQSIK